MCAVSNQSRRNNQSKRECVCNLYVEIYSCMYVRTHVCMQVEINQDVNMFVTELGKHKSLDLDIAQVLYVCMYVCMHECMYVCMYLCM
jgi:hypothetical protein